MRDWRSVSGVITYKSVGRLIARIQVDVISWFNII